MDYDVILAWQGVAGLWYAVFKQLFFAKGPKIILMGFFFTKRKNKIYACVRYHLVKFAISSVDHIICYSRKEVEYYNQFFKCDHNKFLFAHFGVNTLRKDIHSAMECPYENYIFSSGSSNRDFSTFFNAVEKINSEVLVITKRFNVKGLKIPSNVQLKFHVYGDDYRQIFLKSKFIIIPLSDIEVSAGLMVLLDAMMYGKALIITHTWSSEDYITHMENGFLVSPHDCNDLQEKIQYLLDNPDEIKRIGANARKTLFEKYSMKQLARNVSNIITKI